MADTVKAPFLPTATTPDGAADTTPATVIHVTPVSDDDVNTCEWTTGWTLFCLGFLLYLPWVVAVLLPCGDRESSPKVRRNNLRAAKCSAAMLVVAKIVIMTLIHKIPRG
jgi:hypothetical protein